MRESKIEDHLRRRVLKAGGKSYKWLGEAGLPDRVIFLPGGKFHIVELKTIGGTLSPIQKLQHRTLAALGFEVYVPYSIEDVDEFLERIL